MAQNIDEAKAIIEAIVNVYANAQRAVATARNRVQLIECSAEEARNVFNAWAMIVKALESQPCSTDDKSDKPKTP